MKKVAVLLAGAGVFDGSEINEAVFTLLALSKYSVDYQCYAPDKMQYDVINHANNKEDSNNYSRNILAESARITRGDIKPLDQLNIDDISSIIIPGGFGVAKNFCNYSVKGKGFEIDEEIKRSLLSCHNQGKYIGAICVSPVILSKLFIAKKPILTLGNKDNCDKNSEALGIKFEIKNSDEICVDDKNKIVTTPAFMNEETNYKVYLGIEKLVKYIGDRTKI